MKKFLLLLFAINIFLNSWAQTDMMKEIISFSDTTEMMIRNGRKLVVEKTISGNHSGAIETINYLKNNSDEKYVIFYPAEEILISLATRNFQLFLFTARNYNTLLEGKTKVLQFESVLPDVHSYLGDEMNFIADELENSSLTDTEKEFVRLYIRYYLNDDKAKLNNDIRKYQKNNQKSEYHDFLNELKRLSATGSMNFCMGYGNEFLVGNISNTFTNHFHILNIEYDGFVNNWYFSAFMGGSISKVFSNANLPVKKKDWIHTKDQNVSSLKYGAKVGHSVYKTEKLNLYPYFSIGGYEMNSQSDDFEDDSDEPKNNLTGSFMAGIGASCNFLLKTWDSKYTYEPLGYFFVRPSVGYDQFIGSKEISKGGDFYFLLSIGLGLSGSGN